ncbi:orexin receptor type 2-like [Mercenaria mercenaria]|uniref:orexin receptor type 2-like n=1 Tax=Mercenaria mercenaria TaxID=6596 RepID=UPI00234F4EF7|nr:orexin receptor type 2-like [Mercenaria mercenaria]
MPSYSAESLSKHSFGEIDASGYNRSNITYMTDGADMETLQHQQFLILLPSFIYTAFLMMVGMPGNFIVIIVYLLKMTKTTSRHFIISLAICDFINCAFGMPVELSLIWNFYSFDYPILCKISRFSTFFMNNTSSCVLIAIAVDRFRRVCLPLRPNMTVKHSKIICITVTIISIISAVPSLFIYGTRTILLPAPLNDTMFVLKTCYVDDSVGTKLPLIFNLYMFIIIILMILCLGIMYALVGRVVCSRKHFSDDSFRKLKFGTSVSVDSKSRFSTRFLKSFSEHSPKLFHSARTQERKDSPVPDIAEPLAIRDRAHSDISVRRHGGKEIRAGRTTTILFIVTLIFVLSFVPYLAIVTMRYIKKDLTKSMTPVQLTVYNLTLRSYLLNSAVNPIVYCFLNRQFRMKVKLFFGSIFCRCKK